MLLLRLLGLLMVLAIGVCAALGLLTRQPHFFQWAWRLSRYAVVLVVVFVIVFVLERVLAPIV
ncbi:MAG: hypothetical protein REI09_04570 [Candidatus Dactylopiibacterium sp.]|nr:hypothetical protein [Candidatus Dactylopiibacterium sp.]